MKNPYLWGGVGIAALVGFWVFKKEEPVQPLTQNQTVQRTQPSIFSGFIFGMDPKETDAYYEHSGRSLYPGFGTSDLNKPGREEVKGLENCAKWCNENADCVAFHHWWKHPDEEVKDTCFYWSGNQHESEVYEIPSEALGPGDEGKGTGHRVNAYIKKEFSGYAAENTVRLTCQSHHAF